MDEEGNSHQIPKNWVWTSVGQLYEVVGGGTPSTKNPKYWNGDIPWITSADIHGIKDIRPRKNVTKEGIRESATNLVPEGSLIIVTRVGLGKVAITKTPLCFSQDSQALIGNNALLNPEYSLYYLSKAVQIFKYKHRGTTIAGVTKNQLRNLSFPLPPFPEQIRIVIKLEELFTRLDASVKSLRNVKAQLQLYRQSVLKHAFNGKLTEEWRKTHKNTIQPATTLLEQIKQERKKKEKEKYREPTKIDTTNLPELPETWAWTTIIEIGEVVTGKTPKKNIPAYYGDTYPFFKPADLNSGFYVKASTDGLSDEGIKQSRLLPAKSTLVTCIGATIGKTGFIRVDGASNQQINAIIPCKNIVPEFVYFYCISPQFQKEIMNNYSSTTLPILNKSKFQKLHVALPSYLEQKRIAEELESYFSTIDNTEKIEEKNLLWSERLRQSILKIAFEGRLVAQDLSDEPADVLLEQIRQEKERQDNKKKGTRSRRKSRKRSQRRLNGYVE